MSLFENATRKKFRFPSSRGALDTEQLWDVPLTSKDDFNLEAVAQSVNAQLQSLSTNAFVNVSPNPEKEKAREIQEQKLEVVKHVIAVKVEEKKAADQRASNNEKRRKLLDALAMQEDKALATMSKDDILKQLAALDG